MANSIISMTVVTVKLGSIEFEGLMDETGKYYIAIQQATNLFSVRPDNAQKTFKALLGEGFQFVKFTAKRAERQNRPENAIELLHFERLLRGLDKKGNPQAEQIAEQLIGLSLTQLFADAFDQKFEKEERQNYLLARQQGKYTRRCMTDSIKSWCDRNGVPEKIQGYSVYCSEALNTELFGKKSAELKVERSVGKNDLLRDSMTSNELTSIYRIEDRVILLVDMMNIKPTDAIKQVLNHDKLSNSNAE